jgi:hypothetical protein
MLAIDREARQGLFAAVALGCLGCAVQAEEKMASVAEPLIYGTDDRKQYYEIDDDSVRALIANSSVALLPKSAVVVGDGSVALQGPAWRAADNLCPDVRFSADPVVAYCSAVLVEPDLVLTAGHCLYPHDCSNLALVRNYRRDAVDTMASLSLQDLRGCDAILTWSSGEEEPADRIDFAWIRLDRPFTLPNGWTPIRFSREEVTSGEPIISAGYGGGGPVKLASGAVVDPRSQSSDYFLTNLDAFAGMSGAPVFDASQRLVGIDNRGASDFTFDPVRGCQSPRVLDDDAGGEAATRAIRALDSLCREFPDRTVCRQLFPLPFTSGGGCQVSVRTYPKGWRFAGFLTIWALAARRARRRGVSTGCLPKAQRNAHLDDR